MNESEYEVILEWGTTLASALKSLESAVRRKRASGWELQGGVCIESGQHIKHAAQAMTRGGGQ